MKKLLILIITLFAIQGYSQTCPAPYKFVDKKYYTVCYSEELENPIWVKYIVYNPEGLVNKDYAFRKEPGVITADNDDYYNNDWDMGHLAPANDFRTSLEKLSSTYSMVNCTPQHYSLNRGKWSSLESWVRAWSFFDSLLVVNEPLFDGPCEVLPTGLVIPHAFRKTIISLTTGERRIFEMPNESCPNDLMFYQVKRDTINLYWYGVKNESN